MATFLAFLAEHTTVGERSARLYVAHLQRFAAWLVHTATEDPFDCGTLRGAHGGVGAQSIVHSATSEITFGNLLRKARCEANLTQSVLAERAGLSGQRQPSEWVAACASLESRNNLPTPLTAFIGRERELKQIQQLLNRVRLVTLAGSGGIGKTRLALEVTRRLADTPADGICWIELAALMDDGLVPQVVAAALDVPEQSDRSVIEVLVDALASRRLLLVLDNCEHLATACARFAETVLLNCPGVRILATSRQPLGIQGEATCRVPTLTEAEAIRLFVDRAQAVEPQWILTERRAKAVAQVCQRLDGIPLAIEFAAARIVVLAPEQIAERLADRFALLTATGRTAPARHQTLRATLDWSYALLGPDEQLLFDRLSVFAGGWDLEAAEAVCGAGSIEPHKVLDLLKHLIEQSMVLAVHPEHGPVRYQLLETLREYGRERLEQRADIDAASNRHAEFFLALAEHAEPELLGPRWMDARASFEREQDNIRAALRWLVTRGDTQRALRLAGSLARFWFFHGYFDEGNAWLTRVLTLPGSAPTAGRARCLYGIGTIAMMRGDVAAAESALHEALGIWRELGNLAQQGFVLFVLGMAARQHGARAEASNLFEAGLAASRAAVCAPAEANNLAGLADVSREQGQLGPARTYGEQALKCASAAGYVRGEVHALKALGEITQEIGEYGAATQLLESGLAKSRELGAQWLSAWSLVRLGVLAIHRGESSDADALLAESLDLSRQTGDRQGIHRCLEAFAELTRAQEQEATSPQSFTDIDGR